MSRIKGYVKKWQEGKEPELLEEEREKEIERLPTGVEELDRGIEGGIPVGSWVVITGEPGTGKTVLTHHAVASAIRHGYGVVIVSTELKKWEWLAQAKGLNIPVDDYPIVKLEDIVRYKYKEDVLEYNYDNVPKNFRTVFIDIYTLARFAKIKGMQERDTEKKRRKWYSYLDLPVLSFTVDTAFRVFAEDPRKEIIKLKQPVLFIVDSLSLFYLKAPNMAAKVALDLALRFKKNNTVGLLVTQYAWTTGTTYGARVEHIADGVIHLWMDNVESTKEVRRYLIIKKMRMTQHRLRAYKVYIEKGKGMYLEPI